MEEFSCYLILLLHYYILKKTEVPTVIVECGFLSNHKEAEKLSDEAYQGKIAEAVVKGIKSFFLK